MPEAAQQPPPEAQEHDDRDIAPVFHEDMTLWEMKASFLSNKGALTRLSYQVRVRAETFIASQLNESYNKFLAKCDFLHRANWTSWMRQKRTVGSPPRTSCNPSKNRCNLAWQPRPPETGGITPGASRIRVRMDLKPWGLSSIAMLSEFRRWRRKFEQYFLGSDLGVTHIPGQQAALAGCVDTDIEQHLYSMISDNAPIFTPEPNEDKIKSCMDFIYDWITERHPPGHTENGAFQAIPGMGGIHGRLLQQDLRPR